MCEACSQSNALSEVAALERDADRIAGFEPAAPEAEYPIVYYTRKGNSYPSGPVAYELFFHNTLGLVFYHPSSGWQSVHSTAVN